MRKLKENNGDFSVNGAMLLLVIAIVLVLAISVIGAVNSVAKLNGISDQLARYISICGAVNSSVTAEQERLIADSGLDADDCTVTISANYISGTKKIQFGESITVRIQYSTKFGIGGVVSVPITLTGSAEGRSEVYWK